MKTLIIYYSLTGNTDTVAKALKNEFDATLVRIRPQKELDTKNPTHYFWGGAQVFMNQKPTLEAFNVNLNDYDFIIIGTPVWAFSYSAPINTLFSLLDFSGKNVAIYCTSEGGEKKTLENMRKRLKGSKIIGEKNFLFYTEEQKNAIEREVKNWVDNLKNSLCQ